MSEQAILRAEQTLQPTASSVAWSKLSFRTGPRLTPVFLAAALLLCGVSVSWMALVHPLG